MKDFKEFLVKDERLVSLWTYCESKNNGKEIVNDIIVTYFGYEPKKLSDENIQCKTNEDIYKLVEDMELVYAHNENSKDPYDEKDRELIHKELINWVKTHSK